ncbi:MAG TPA: hypothetical protein VGK73_13940 [Polyangiaceae bacterium]
MAGAGDSVELAKAQYLAAWRWRRGVEKSLAPMKLTLTQWLVLEATASLIAERDDAVNQNAVAARTELDRMTISQVMTTLAVRSLVDRAPDLDGRAYRIYLTQRGKRCVSRAARLVASATRHFRVCEDDRAKTRARRRAEPS